RLARQSDELQSSLLKAEELNKRVLSLESRTSELQEELSVSKGETVEVRRSMQLALDEQVAATKLAKQEASSNFDA
ncbi:hypothetical protein, partial [Legionella sp. 28fT52]